MFASAFALAFAFAFASAFASAFPLAFAFALPSQSRCVSIKIALRPVPGLLHILHYAGNSILSVVPRFDAAVSQLAEVCTLIRSEDTCTRMRERCFAGLVAQEFHQQLKAFSAKVYRARWGTVAFAVADILKLAAPLRRFWDLKRNLGGAQPGPEEEGGSGSMWPTKPFPTLIGGLC